MVADQTYLLCVCVYVCEYVSNGSRPDLSVMCVCVCV